MDYSLIAGFVIGLFSVLHCLGMCGSIIGALTLSLPEEIRFNRRRLFFYVLAYNLGRLTSYILAGAVIGTIGMALFQLISPYYGHRLIQAFAGLVLLGIGLYLAGWFPLMAYVEKIGVPLWRWLDPLRKRLIPVRTPGHAFLFGIVWGWLPCGLVYSVLVWAAASGGPVEGALRMLAFGVGTLPGLVTAGVFTGWLTRLLHRPYARQIAGLIVIAFGLAALALAALGISHMGPHIVLPTG